MATLMDANAVDITVNIFMSKHALTDTLSYADNEFTVLCMTQTTNGTWMQLQKGLIVYTHDPRRPLLHGHRLLQRYLGSQLPPIL